MGPLSAWVGRAGAATRRNLGDSKGQQETTNLEVSSRFAAIHLGSEIPGLRFHTAEATGSKPVTPTTHLPRSAPSLIGRRRLPGRWQAANRRRAHSAPPARGRGCRRDVGVAVQGRARLLMAHHRLDDVHRHPLRHKPGRIAMAQVMELGPLHQAGACKRGQPHPLTAEPRQAANRRRTPCNQPSAADTQRQQTPRSEPLSQHCHWSGDSDACVHTAAAVRQGFKRSSSVALGSAAPAGSGGWCCPRRRRSPCTFHKAGVQPAAFGRVGGPGADRKVLGADLDLGPAGGR